MTGSPTAYAFRSGKGWKYPKQELLDNKYICHAVITFETEIAGPVVIGSGRYYGLGLFLPSKKVI